MTTESSDPNQPAIVADQLSRAFDTKVAVEEVELRLRRGEIYGFLGPNGAGKSTTVRMLCTLLAPTSGSATVAGHDVVAHPDRVRSSIGVALQDVALDPRQTGLEQLRLQGRLYGLMREEIDERIDALATLVDIGDALAQQVSTYSGGMRRRLDLAVALVHNPAVLFLDEPTTGLDPVSRVRVWDEVQRLNRELGMTIFLTTQYLEEADALADRVGIIDGGRLVAEGTPDELKRSVGQDLVIARLATDAAGARTAVEGVDGVHGVEARRDELVISVERGPSAIGPIAIALDNAAVPVRDLTLRTPTLDDVFLELTGTRIQREDGENGDDHEDRVAVDGDHDHSYDHEALEAVR
jgi:ABC-2 type transport system ATP-binding protein